MQRTEARKSLSGKTILVTRAAAQAREFGSLLESRGASVVYFPTIEIIDPDSWVDCDRALGDLKRYDRLIFTSRNGVQFFLRRITSVRPEAISTVQRCRVYAVGDQTKRALEEFGIPVARTPKEFTAQDLARSLPTTELNGHRFLHARGNLGGDEIRHAIESHGGRVDEVVVYRTAKPAAQNAIRVEQLLRKHGIDLVTFFSPSSIQNFFDVIPQDSLQNIRLAAVGPVTASALKTLGLPVHIVPPQSTAASLTQSIEQHYR
ncbi:MAG: uroporphyrinogen-III synthase [Bacteroidota bacterium]